MKNYGSSPDIQKAKYRQYSPNLKIDPVIDDINAKVKSLEHKYSSSPRNEQNINRSPKRAPNSTRHQRPQQTFENLKTEHESELILGTPPRTPIRKEHSKQALQNLKLELEEHQNLFEQDFHLNSKRSQVSTPSNRNLNVLSETVANCQSQIIHLIGFSTNKSDQEKRIMVHQIFQQLETDLYNTQEVADSQKLRNENQYLKDTIDVLSDDVNKLQQKFIQQIDNHAVLLNQVKCEEDNKAALAVAKGEIRQLQERLGQETERSRQLKEDSVGIQINPQPSPIRSYKSNQSGDQMSSSPSNKPQKIQRFRRNTPVQTPQGGHYSTAVRSSVRHQRWNSEGLKTPRSTHQTSASRNTPKSPHPSSASRNPPRSPRKNTAIRNPPRSPKKQIIHHHPSNTHGSELQPELDFMALQLLSKEGIEEQLEQLKEDLMDQKVLLKNSNEVRKDMEKELERQKQAYLDQQDLMEKDATVREDTKRELERQKQAYVDLSLLLDNAREVREELEEKLERQDKFHQEEKGLIEEYMETAESMQQMTVVYISHSIPVDEAGEQALESMKQQEYVKVDPDSQYACGTDYKKLKTQVSLAHENITKLQAQLEEECQQNDRLEKHNYELTRLAKKLETDIQEIELADLESKKLAEANQEQLQKLIADKSQELLEQFTEVEKKNKQLEDRITQANDLIDGKLRDLLSFISVVTTSRQSDASGQEWEKLLADLNVQNLELKNRITIETCNRSSVEQQLTDQISTANAEIQRLICQNSELLHELESKSSATSMANSNLLSSQRISSLLNSQRISIFPEHSTPSPRGTHVTTETQTDMHLAEDKQRSKKQAAKQERDVALETVQSLTEQIGMIWEDISVQENKLYQNMSTLLAQEEGRMQNEMDQALKREKNLKDQIGKQDTSFKKIKRENELMRMDLESQYDKANRLSEEVKKSQSLNTTMHNSVEAILDCFVGQNQTLNEHLLKQQESGCRTPQDLAPETGAEQNELKNQSDCHGDGNITAFIGFLDTSSQTSSEISNSFTFRKAMHCEITWWLIEPVGNNSSESKEYENAQNDGKIAPNEDTEENFLQHIQQILNQQFGDRLIDAIDSLLTRKEKQFISSYDLTWGSQSQSKKSKTEPTFELKQVISDLRKENCEYEIQQNALQDSIKSLEQELCNINKQMRTTDGDASSSFRETFVKFWKTIPIGKPETESSLRILLSLLNYNELQKGEIFKARANISRPPRSPDSFNFFGRNEFD